MNCFSSKKIGKFSERFNQERDYFFQVFAGCILLEVISYGVN